jgi:DNA-binding NarL/FixJ family response regulator
VIRVLLADDQALVRGGFRMILEAQEDIEITGEAADGREALDEARRTTPDVVLMDIRMPGMDGLEATRRLLEAGAAGSSSSSCAAPPPGAAAPEALSSLTERELDVLRRIARGRSNAEIAGELFLSEGTVKTHVTHLLSKLGLRDRVQAVVTAYETGLVEPGDEP